MIQYNVMQLTNPLTGSFLCPICGVTKEVNRLPLLEQIEGRQWPTEAWKCPNLCRYENGLPVMGEKARKRRTNPFKKR